MSTPTRTYVIGIDEKLVTPPLFRKVEDSRLDYSFDWTQYLAQNPGSTIVDFYIETTTNIGVEPPFLEGDIVTFWVTPDADIGVSHPIECTITTAQGLRDTRTMLITVVETR